MALNIDKKVYRNLQEQVSWLTSTVGEIIDITDASKLEELVTELEGYKDDFEGYADIMAGYADTMGGYATTMQGYADTMGGYATTMQGYASQVDTWTNNIGAAAISAITNANISPNNISASGTITGNSIVENMSGYSFTKQNPNFHTPNYVGVVKNGNKVTFVIAGTINRPAGITGAAIDLGRFTIPTDIASKLIEITNNIISFQSIKLFTSLYSVSSAVEVGITFEKYTLDLRVTLRNLDLVTEGTNYYYRIENTFLISENLAA